MKAVIFCIFKTHIQCPKEIKALCFIFLSFFLFLFFLNFQRFVWAFSSLPSQAILFGTASAICRQPKLRMFWCQGAWHLQLCSSNLCNVRHFQVLSCVQCLLTQSLTPGRGGLTSPKPWLVPFLTVAMLPKGPPLPMSRAHYQRCQRA